jgi:hypothetical protein
LCREAGKKKKKKKKNKLCSQQELSRRKWGKRGRRVASGNEIKITQIIEIENKGYNNKKFLSVFTFSLDL